MSQKPSIPSPAYITVAAVIFLVIIICAFGSFYQVDQGERGVVLRNGKLSSVAEPGLGFKVPAIESVRRISVRDQALTMKLEAYSFDQQPAQMLVSVTYRVPVDRVANLYSEYGTLNNLQSRVIERRTPDAVKNVFGRFTAVRAIQERENLGIETTRAVNAVMRDAPIQIVGVQIEEVSFSQAYEQSIEQRMLAQVQIETTRQQKETASINAEIQVVKAKAAADALREQFQAEADGIRLRGEAEAAAIQARAEALAANTNLVDLIAVEKWNGALPTTQVPGSALPFIGVK
ncbi:Band 7 protein [Cephaloticoccus primus]|uniref:Band 7 protein n=1 Tax=Cephaloticoccus primus TaxID=1548207 RepID=A0A139SJG8_9BACT|nr:prohibitin family protein [Cephaloticoccus primus]KXU34676.1 Band 7 protein [Cephaloticoccus primus]